MEVRSYSLVTAAYWGFTLTDGALRMLVLLHFHALGYTPLHLAFLFVLYECCGMVTNLLGGWIGSRMGVRVTLFAGLALPVVALLMLSGLSAGLALVLQAGWYPALSVIAGLAVFGLIFAVNSSVHSYLILAYTDADQVTLNVGFYYMANASGRLLGTLLLGSVYLLAGLPGCLWTSAVLVFAAAGLTLLLPAGRVSKEEWIMENG